MYSVLNTLSEYKYFYISKTLLHRLLLLVSKIIENLQCILKRLLDWTLLYYKAHRRDVSRLMWKNFEPFWLIFLVCALLIVYLTSEKSLNAPNVTVD